MPAEAVSRENKRECVDGMRACHQSEISHANHAITMLLVMSAAVGAVVVAILIPEKPPVHVHEIAWGLHRVRRKPGLPEKCHIGDRGRSDEGSRLGDKHDLE